MEGMVGIPDPGAPDTLLFCIDAYENLATGELGDKNQLDAKSTPIALFHNHAGAGPRDLLRQDFRRWAEDRHLGDRSPRTDHEMRPTTPIPSRGQGARTSLGVSYETQWSLALH